MNAHSIKNMSMQELYDNIVKLRSEINRRHHEFEVKDEWLRPPDHQSGLFIGLSKNGHFMHNLKYLPHLLRQDWGGLFDSPHFDDSKIYYVYAHVDPSLPNFKIKKFDSTLPGVPFYIGKGSGGRATDLNRNAGHGQKIKHLLRSGYEASDITCVIKDGLSEAKAFELESKLIYFFGTVYEPFRKKGVLLNLDRGKTPKMIKKKLKKKVFVPKDRCPL